MYDDQNQERFDQKKVEPESVERREPPIVTRPQGPSTAMMAVILLLVCAVVVSLGYTFSARKQSEELAARQAQTANALQQSMDSLAAMRTKLDAMNVPAAQPTAAASLPVANQPATTQTLGTRSGTARARVAGKSRVHRKPRAVEDPRWAKVQKQLSDQQQQLTSTQQDLENARQELSDNLQSARDDLNGSIAKNHDELVALEKKGERDYQEFDLVKSKSFQHVGPVGMELKKANTKHDFYDVTLLVNDYKLDKKHVNLYEPVWIYPADSRQPLELVVNQISKDKIHGYVSAPKYPDSGRTAQSVAAPADDNGDSTAAPTAGSASDASENQSNASSSASSATPKEQ